MWEQNEKWILLVWFGVFWVVLMYNPQLVSYLFPVSLGIPYIYYRFWNRNTVILSDTSLPAESSSGDIRDLIHQIRAPLAGLKIACDQLKRDPKNENLVLTMARTLPQQIDGLLKVTSEISRISKSSKTKTGTTKRSGNDQAL